MFSKQLKRSSRYGSIFSLPNSLLKTMSKQRPVNLHKQLIHKRISEISCDEHEFEKAKEDYNKAFEKSGSTEKVKYYK